MPTWQHERTSGCKVNLLLNILEKRPDGFHELETIMHPVAVHDRLSFAKTASGIELTCTDATLPVDQQNLVYRAAAKFLEQAGIKDGVRIHLEKNLPLAAGLGGGSGNAAQTLLGLNELFGGILDATALNKMAASLGSDIPFFLQENPALGVGRGEEIQSLAPFPALAGAAFVLVHPGFGISTPWAYRQLARFPKALNGERGRYHKVLEVLNGQSFSAVGSALYNSLEAPALQKYPLLVLFQEFFREHGADATLMSGSGSTTFAIARNEAAGQELAEEFKGEFGTEFWVRVVKI